MGDPVDSMSLIAEASEIPWWLALSYLVSNLTLNGLNFYWFAKMIRAIRKRFQPPRHSDRETKLSGPVGIYTEAKTLSSVESRLRKRRA